MNINDVVSKLKINTKTHTSIDVTSGQVVRAPVPADTETGLVDSHEKKGLHISPHGEVKKTCLKLASQDETPASESLIKKVLPDSDRRGFLRQSMGVLSVLSGGNPLLKILTPAKAVKSVVSGILISDDDIVGVLAQSAFQDDSGFLSGLIMQSGFLPEQVASLKKMIETDISTLSDISPNHDLIKEDHVFSSHGFSDNSLEKKFKDPDSLAHVQSCSYCKMQLLRILVGSGMENLARVEIIKEGFKIYGQVGRLSKSKLLKELDERLSAPYKGIPGYEHIFEEEKARLRQLREAISTKSDAELVSILKTKVDGALKTVSECGTELFGACKEVAQKLPPILTHADSVILEAKINPFYELKKKLDSSGGDNSINHDALVPLEHFETASEISNWLNKDMLQIFVDESVDFKGLDLKGIFYSIYSDLHPADKVLYFSEDKNNLLVTYRKVNDETFSISFHVPQHMGASKSILNVNVGLDGKVQSYKNNFIEAELDKPFSNDSDSRKTSDILGDIFKLLAEDTEQDVASTVKDYINGISGGAERRLAQVLYLHRENILIDSICRAVGLPNLEQSDKDSYLHDLRIINEKKVLVDKAERAKISHETKPRGSIPFKRGIQLLANSYSVSQVSEGNNQGYITSPKLEEDFILITLHHGETKRGVMIHSSKEGNLEELIVKAVHDLKIPAQDLKIRLLSNDGEFKDKLVQVSRTLKHLGAKDENIVEVDISCLKLPREIASQVVHGSVKKLAIREVSNLVFDSQNGSVFNFIIQRIEEYSAYKLLKSGHKTG